MEKPLRRLCRVLQELPEEMQMEIGMHAIPMLGLPFRLATPEEAGPEQDGVSVWVPAPRHLCSRLQRLSKRTKMSLKFLILSLLRQLKEEFAVREEACRKEADAEQGMQRLQHLRDQAAVPMDDREELVNDTDLEWSIAWAKGQLATAPALNRAMLLLISAIQRILAREFSPEYWKEVGLA